jgi:hypothetical protein
MSAFLDVANDIKTHLDAVLDTAASGVVVIVDRQKDVLSEITKAVGKAKGACVTILFTGYNRRNGRKVAGYAIRIWSKPVLQGEENLADDLLASIDAAIHHYIPPSMNAAQDNCHFQIEVQDGDMVPDKNFLLYEITATAPVL